MTPNRACNFLAAFYRHRLPIRVELFGPSNSATKITVSPMHTIYRVELLDAIKVLTEAYKLR